MSLALLKKKRKENSLTFAANFSKSQLEKRYANEVCLEKWATGENKELSACEKERLLNVLMCGVQTCKKFVLFGDAGDHDKSHVKTRRISKGKAQTVLRARKKNPRKKNEKCRSVSPCETPSSERRDTWRKTNNLTVGYESRRAQRLSMQVSDTLTRRKKIE